MKTRAWLLLILIALARPQDAAGQAAGWSRYTYPGEEFSVELPSMPRVFHTSRRVDQTSYESEKVRVFGLYADEVVYMIVSFDRPRSSESDDKLANYGWSGVKPRGEVKLGALTGREYDLGFDFKGTARFFRMKNRAYLVKSFSDVEGRQQAVERFLNSFSLDRQRAGTFITDNLLLAPSAPPTEQSSPANVSGDGPYKSSELVQKAVLVYKPEPGYTEEARRNNVTGVVRLRAVLHASGAIQRISVVKGLPDGLTEKAIAAARHILFFPAVKAGRRVSQYVVLEYNFNIF